MFLNINLIFARTAAGFTLPTNECFYLREGFAFCWWNGDVQRLFRDDKVLEVLVECEDVIFLYDLLFLGTT